MGPLFIHPGCTPVFGLPWYSCGNTSGNSRGSWQTDRHVQIVYSKELPEMLENEVVVGVAEKHGRTPAQVCLRYIIQRDIVVIPKSTSAERLTENVQVTQ